MYVDVQFVGAHTVRPHNVISGERNSSLQKSFTQNSRIVGNAALGVPPLFLTILLLIEVRVTFVGAHNVRIHVAT